LSEAEPPEVPTLPDPGPARGDGGQAEARMLQMCLTSLANCGTMETVWRLIRHYPSSRRLTTGGTQPLRRSHGPGVSRTDWYGDGFTLTHEQIGSKALSDTRLVRLALFKLCIEGPLAADSPPPLAVLHMPSL
jgi:hypothetical protein